MSGMAEGYAWLAAAVNDNSTETVQENPIKKKG
jgi:hypothetical protein